MAIPQTFIQELLARADVVEIVGRYVQLKKGGANYSGLCPFHAEKSPSFTVSPTKQFYHCFGCGKNGNAISFLMDHSGMNFVEAVKDLAQQYGMQVPEDDQSPEDRARAAAQREHQQTLTSVLEKAGEAYRRHLRESQRAIEYCKQRGLSGEIARQFGLGYAPAGWRSLASVFPHYDEPLLVESGLVISNQEDGSTEEKRYDRFRDRLMFPIRNVKGECIGFGGRVLGDEKPKYLNSPETPVFSKGRELYGLFEARNALREAGYVLVTEGYMDVVALAQLGFPNAVATLGTACTNDHVQKLFRFTDAVVFSFDGDAAGRRAAHKALDAALPYATDVRSIKFLFLPAEHDPDSYIRAHGKDAFALCVSEATPLSRFLLDSAREGCDLSSAEGRAHMASNAKPLWQKLPEGALKLQLLTEIADLVGLDGRELNALWNPAPAAGSRRPYTGKARPPASGGWNEAAAEDWLPADALHAPPSGGPAGSGSSAGGTWRPGGAAGTRSGLGWGGAGRRAARRGVSSRADHALRILLAHNELWDGLSNEDHELLHELPEPHGPLVAWLEAQLHALGPQPWQSLQVLLQGHPLQDFARQLVSAHPMPAEALDQPDLELRELLNRLLIDRLKLQETQAIESASADPGALQRYRELQARRLQLEKLVGPEGSAAQPA